MPIPGSAPMGVVVVGEATSLVAADAADVTLLLATAGPSAAQAVREGAMGLLRIDQSLRAIGVKQGDIKPRIISVQPLFPPANWPAMAGGGPVGVPVASFADLSGDIRPVTGFRVIGSVCVVIRDPAQVGDVLDTAVAAGATSVADVSFRLQDEEKVRRTSLVQAIADARAKAEVIAALLGRHAGDPMELVEEPALPATIVSCSGNSDSYHLESAQTSATPVLLGRLAFPTRIRARFELT